MQFANSITVTLRRLEVDAFGDETVIATFPVSGCAVAQQSAYETTGDLRQHTGDFRQDSTTRLRLLAPAAADVRAGDEIVLPSGDRFRIRGDPAAPRSPFTGWRPGVAADMERVKG